MSLFRILASKGETHFLEVWQATDKHGPILWIGSVCNNCHIVLDFSKEDM